MGMTEIILTLSEMPWWRDLLGADLQKGRVA